MYSFLVDNHSEHKKAKDVNKNVVEIITHSESKDFLLNKNFLRHSLIWIQSKDHKIATYEISKILLSWFDDNIYTLNNGYDGLAFGY